MRQIGLVRDESDAHALADYLLTLGITCRLDRTDGGWAIWVHHEDRVKQAQAELDAFVKNPSDARFRGHAAAARSLRRQAEREQREHLKNTLDVRYIWSARDWRRCPVTWALITVCLAVTLFSKFGQDDRVVRPLLIASYQVVPLRDVGPEPIGPGRIDQDRGVWYQSDLAGDLRRGELWRLITPIFLHFGPIHLAFNLTVLYQLGTMIEIRRGRRLLIVLVLCSAVASNLGQYLYTYYPRFGGFSGVDLALFGYVWMKGMYEPDQGLGLSPGTVIFVVLFLAVTMLTPQFDFIAHAAHIVGLGVGVLFGVGPHLIPVDREPAD